ncbi:hypothetical protein HO133_010809 [Letharia lupina]|uniref:Uncharacterized protein n=1 Tax=Letharia lupina TaxID=560253 RepID=A0A8H6CIQ8_9LECA|nr:uncharacterized protein HO133_010809 [Letharia lupina]KAF6224234.1 hypothetical protein HO133_010809 [Letharia lupina]
MSTKYPPPAYPPPAHQDAGPYYPPTQQQQQQQGPYHTGAPTPYQYNGGNAPGYGGQDRGGGWVGAASCWMQFRDERDDTAGAGEFDSDL